MSSITKSNGFATAIIERIHADTKFKCGRSYSDMLIWTRLCNPLTDTEIFALLPVTIRTVWSNEEAAFALTERRASKIAPFNMQNLAANIVCFRRTDIQNDEIGDLKSQLANVSQQFNSLSYSVFEILDRLTTLEEENHSLKSELAAKGVIDPLETITVLSHDVSTNQDFISTTSDTLKTTPYH